MTERQNVGSQHRFRLIYAGNFYGSRTPWVFLRGLADAAARNSALARDTRVEFYGVFDRRRLRRYCENHGLGSMVSLHSRIPRAELLRKLQRAGMLLLINSYGPGHEMFLPAKFFDYLAAARPILCLAEDGAVKRAVDQTGAGMVVDPRDTDAVSAALLQLYRDFHQRKLAFRIDPQKTMSFRASQTGDRFAELCRQSIAASGRRR